MKIRRFTDEIVEFYDCGVETVFQHDERIYLKIQEISTDCDEFNAIELGELNEN